MALPQKKKKRYKSKYTFNDRIKSCFLNDGPKSKPNLALKVSNKLKEAHLNIKHLFGVMEHAFDLSTWKVHIYINCEF